MSIASEYADEALGEVPPGSHGPIEGRSLSQIAWRRLRKDKVAFISGIVVVVLILVAVSAPLLTALYGHSPYAFNTDLTSPDTNLPYGRFGGISSTHWLGIEPTNGRDILSRIIYGARTSLEIALLATIISTLIGTVLGIVAGYFGGWIDTIVSRLMDVMLAFPILLFSMAILVVFQGKNSMFGVSGYNMRVLLLVFIIGFFNWAYIGRIVRGQTLSLREREFVDAARSLGASNSRIIFKELLPNLIAPILVYSTLAIPSNILYEASLSFLGVGVQEPTASWGKMLNNSLSTYTVDPTYMLIPGLAIFITVLAFNQFGDGLRDAFDPKSSR